MSLKRNMAEFLTSRHIKFIVGPDEVHFNVHEKSIAGLSGPLRALVTGPMQESIEAKVVWEDVEPAVFINLMEYAYNGDFSISGHIARTASDDEYFEDNLDALPNKQKETDDGNDKKTGMGVEMTSRGTEPEKGEEKLAPSLFETVAEARQSGKAKRVSYDFAMKSFNCSQSCKFKISQDISSVYDEKQFEASKKMIPCDLDYYMSLAKLYVLAEKYDINELKSLCAFRFSHSLIHTEGSDKIVTHMVVVLRYLNDLTRPNDQLRTVILKYAISDLEWFMTTCKFRAFLQELPEVATELFLMIPSEYWTQVSQML